MTVPLEYAHASQAFERFMLEARDALDLSTSHQTFTVVEAVLWVFRRRLDAAGVAAFAQVLPAVLRAMFIDGWDPAVPPLPFAAQTELAREVQAVRGRHNLAPDNAIETVAGVLRRRVDAEAFDAVLSRLPDGAARYWSAQHTPTD
ncbi:MAG: DUF2267 domain-containing protein [Hyphomicrobiales bacterium]|nr:MAG: DUF2267 domain-containing protein [Hyphomicrobiales bacterium]